MKKHLIMMAAIITGLFIINSATADEKNQVPLTKTQVIEIFKNAVEKCGDDCSCGSEATECRRDHFKKELENLKKLKKLNLVEYLKMKTWFRRNADNEELVKANNVDINIDKAYSELGKLFIK